MINDYQKKISEQLQTCFFHEFRYFLIGNPEKESRNANEASIFSTINASPLPLHKTTPLLCTWRGKESHSEKGRKRDTMTAQQDGNSFEVIFRNKTSK